MAGPLTLVLCRVLRHRLRLRIWLCFLPRRFELLLQQRLLLLHALQRRLLLFWARDGAAAGGGLHRVCGAQRFSYPVQAQYRLGADGLQRVRLQPVQPHIANR